MSNLALDPQRSAAVAASAGTGKTWLLAARITRLLLAGAAPGGILALTFTRKAAAEMQARVTKRLRDLALADDASATAQLKELGLEAEPALLARARGLYEQLLFTPWPLRATTIHAFCQELVTRFALQAGVTPGFEVSEDENALKDAAWQRLQRELQRNPAGEPAQALLTLIHGGRNEWALRQLVMEFLELRNDWRAYAGGEGDGLARLRARLEDVLGVTLEQNLETAIDGEALTARLRMFCGHLRTAEGGIGSVKLESLLPAFELNGAARMACLWAGLFTLAGSARAFKIGAGKSKLLGSQDTERCARLFEEITQELQSLRERQRRQHTLRQTLAAATLGASALRAFEREMQERNVLSFAELEWRAYQLLRQSEAAQWVQYRLDARIEHLLVDEFQDTSDTQWQLLLPLLQEMVAGGERKRSAFIVGDAKQSIYGFRRANPALLAEASEHLVMQLGGARSELSKSWRSAPAVIDFVNALFAHEGLKERLPEFPLHDTNRKALWGQVEVAPLVPATQEDLAVEAFRNPLEIPRPDPENRRAYEEGLLIARRIRALLDERYVVHAEDGNRAVGYGDVMILLRKRTHQAALERALSEAGIPFVGGARGTLLQTVEVSDLLALLRYLASPVRDLDLAHALRSPLFALDDAALITLARAARAQKIHWHTLLSAQAGDAMQRAARLLAQWQALARTLPAHDLIDRILTEGDAAARYEAALPPAQAARVRANLDAFAQLALSTDSGRYPSLSRFLRQLQGASAPDEAPPPSDSGAVRIMTIHAAKGLEAPVVFLAQAASTVSARGSGWLVHWPSGEEQPRELLLAGNRDERDSYSAQLLAAKQAREAAEDINLLYVACTRARQLLHISGYEAHRGSDWHALALAAMQSLQTTTAGDGRVLHASGAAPALEVMPMPKRPMFVVDERLKQPLNVIETPAASTPSQQDQHQPDAAQARHGHAVHFLLQKLSEGRPADGLHAALEAHLASTVSSREFSAWQQQARAVIEAPALRRYYDAAQLRRAWNEVPLHYEGVNGIIDRLVDDGETLWLLDYKTERTADDAGLLARHGAQLRAYREGLRRLWPQRRVRAGLVLTAQQRWLELNET